MASESSFGSHNPFRRKSNTTAPSDAGPPATSPPISSTTTPSDPTAAPSPSPRPLPSSSDFARALSSLPKTDAPPPPVSFAKKKPVKKVRVQSPPPSSPESTGAEHTYPKYPLPARDPDEESSNASASDEELNGESEDPFQNEAPPLPEEALAGMTAGGIQGLQSGLGIGSPSQPPLPPLYTGRGPPPNPFQKTLEDIEREAKDGGQGSADQAAGAGKAGMDVEAFKRLLLTGQGPTPSQSGDGGSITESSSVSRQSIFEASHPPQETPRTSHEISEPEGDEDKRDLISTPQRQGSKSRKKPPPPPATRHGKLIKMGLKNKQQAAALEGSSPGAGFSAVSPTSPRRPSSTSPTDFNKPLPPPPERAEDDDAKNNIFEKEAAGKVPELDIDPDADVVPSPRPPTPPNMSHSASTPVQNPTSTLRKPAPPPRRQGHARNESNIPEDPAATPPRSSLESQRSRSSSIRLNIAAPAPPPPRRQASGASGHTRQSPSVSSPVSNNNNNQSSSSPSFPFPTGPISPGDEASAPKLSPPPPPPQRNTSIRKSASSPSTRLLARGTGGSGMGAGAGAVAPPPPPPPRTRGSSKGSIDGPAAGLSRTRSVDSVRKAGDGGVTPVTEEVEAEEKEGVGVDDDAVRAMLADLDALQREVDAARAAAAGGEGG